jgi:hypothetical protein
MTMKTKEHRWEANQHPLDLQPKTLPLCHRYLRKPVNVFKRYNYFLLFLTDYVKFRSNEYKMAENALSHMRGKLFKDRV